MGEIAILPEGGNEQEKDEVSIEEEAVIISEAKLKKLKNLKMFRGWENEQIIEWAKKRGRTEKPPETPSPMEGLPSIAGVEATTFNEAEYKKLYNQYLQRYKKEYAVDMNDANDAESLRALVRYVIQLETADLNIMKEQSKAPPNHQVLKAFGDFQRSVQMNINELQTSLGVSRKARKEKQVDDFPMYVREIQKKAKDLWERTTVPIRCSVCHIELARYWLNFKDNLVSVNFEIICDKCKETVIYSV